MSFPLRLAILIPALGFEALIVGAGDRTLLMLGLVTGFFAALAAHGATGLADLFDRSTFYFGLIASVEFGYELALHVDTGQSIGEALTNASTILAGTIFIAVLATSFLVRRHLISRSLRTSYFC